LFFFNCPKKTVALTNGENAPNPVALHRYLIFPKVSGRTDVHSAVFVSSATLQTLQRFQKFSSNDIFGAKNRPSQPEKKED
jgi:hypothetical protein